MPAGDYLTRGIMDLIRRIVREEVTKARISALAGGGYTVAPTVGGVTSHPIGLPGPHTGFPADPTLFLNGLGLFSKPVGSEGAVTVFLGAPSAGIVCPVVWAEPALVTGWKVLNDAAGDVQWDIWSDVYGSWPPTVADTITGSDKPLTSAAASAESSALTGWTPTVAAGDIWLLNVDSVSGLAWTALAVEYIRT
jgi:hypothetical protein